MKTLLFKNQKSASPTLKILRTVNNRKLALKLQDGINIIEHKNILYCKSDSNYTEIHLLGGKKIIASKTLKSVAAVLPHNFVRIHQSYIVNTDMIATISNELHLIEGSVLPVSRTHKQEIVNLFKRHITFI